MQIKPEMVISNFKTKVQQKNNQNAQNQIENEEEYLTLPLKEIQPYSIKPKMTLDKKHAKEIYLNDFKLVDYRSYRSKPEIQSKQITLSGTPADEGAIASETENANWKSIDVPYHDYINQTVEQFKTGNFKQTLNRTQYILTFYPKDINALFYGGLCFYNLNEIDQAIESFQKVIANPFNNFDEEALWYLANAYDLKNDKVKAKELLQMIVSQKGYYAKQADKMLKK
jgi:tetratricopeptide (TPR) repeat protein